MIACARDARAAHVRVHGSAKLTAEVQRGSPVTIAGTLTDDTGAPLAGEPVLVSVAREADPDDVAVKRAMREAKPCSGQDLVPLSFDAMARRTDDAGRFCVTLLLPQDRFRLRVSWQGDKGSLIDGAKLEQPFDLTRVPLRLAFDPEVHTLLLDGKTTQLEAVATTDEDGALKPAGGRILKLRTENGQELTQMPTNVSGRARFVVPTSRLGPPGHGELRLSFEGDAVTSFADLRVEVDRQAHAELRLAEPIAAGNTEEGVPAAFDVVTREGAAVPEGSVEVRLGDVVVGAAPVVSGRARVMLTFASSVLGSQPGGALGTDVRARYVPISPYYLAPSDITVKVPPSSASPWRRAPLAALAIAVLALLVLGRWRRPALLAKEPKKEDAEPLGLPRMDVVRPVQHARIGWMGEIIDAHESTPVAGAEVKIERADFRGRTAVATTRADAAGRFKLGWVEIAPGDELVVEGPLHSALRRAVPAEGELRVAIVSRKRAILASLVSWARAKGGAYAGKLEPTPGLIRRLAQNDYRTARWADAVEKGAFDAVTIDRAAEESIEGMRPDAAGNAVPDPKGTDQTSGR
jgi:hypothetical protein